MLSVQQIDEAGKRIRNALHPDLIILFGSHARGKPTQDSDADLLVVASTSLPPQQRYAAVRRLLTDFPAAFDTVVRTPDEYARRRNTVNDIVYYTERYGRAIY